jgi:hypothetical protein
MKLLRIPIILLLFLAACASPKTISQADPGQNETAATPIPPTQVPTEANCDPVVEPLPGSTSFPTALPTSTSDLTARKIIVTTKSDKINGATSSWDALIKNPGADGVSLREALTVANLTQGQKLITFDPNLAGQTLMLTAETHQPLPRLSSGDLTIDGDIDHDGKPDITLDGSEGGIGPMDIAGPTSFGFVVWSGGNQINGFHFQNIAGPAITFGPNSQKDPKSVSGNKFTNNEIIASRGNKEAILMGTAGQTSELLDGYTWQDTTIAGNYIEGGDGFTITVIAGGGSSNDKFIGTTIRDNSLKPGGIGLLIADTNSNWHTDKTTTPIFSSGNQLINTVVLNNQLDGVKYYAIGVLGGNGGNHDNLIQDLTISGNTITNTPIGIHIISGDVGDQWRQPTQNNLIEKLRVNGNEIVSPDTGIFISAGGPLWYSTEFAYIVSNLVKQVEVRSNKITDYKTTGIEIWGARANDSADPIQNNVISNLDISGNILSTNIQKAFAGILLIGGLTLDERGAQISGAATQNGIENVTVMKNQVQGGGSSIMVLGGRGPRSTENFIRSQFLSGNQVDHEAIISENDSGATNNQIEVISICPK